MGGITNFFSQRYARTLKRFRRWGFRFQSLKSVFTTTYNNNLFGAEKSKSGPGSDLSQTAAIRDELPGLLKELGVKSMLDAPCGDFYWMSQVELGIERYVGGEIVPQLVADNNRQYGGPARSFVEVDLTADALPQVDLIFCRDCLVHLSYRHLFAALRNCKNSKAKFLLTTTFTARTENRDIVSGEWRPINLELPPFSLPKPERVIVEKCMRRNGAHADKSMGLWKLDAIQV